MNIGDMFIQLLLLFSKPHFSWESEILDWKTDLIMVHLPLLLLSLISDFLHRLIRLSLIHIYWRRSWHLTRLVTPIFLGNQKYLIKKPIWWWLAQLYCSFPPDSYLMERELPPVKLLNLQKVFGSLSEYLERLCHLLSLASSQEKTLATLLLGALWRSAREIRFLLQDVHICKSLNYKFTLSQENWFKPNVILLLLNACWRKGPWSLLLGGCWGKELTWKGCC